jgi:hypothetical protein
MTLLALWNAQGTKAYVAARAVDDFVCVAALCLILR